MAIPDGPAHQARKRFGQNFLHDRHVIEQIVRAVNPQPGQHLVEIGPGKGAITAGLLSTGVQLDAIELDRDLVAWLETQYGGRDNFTLRSQDALTVDFAALRNNGEPLRVVGNLPYNISTPLIFHLLNQRSSIHDMHFMLQQEVVERMAASPGSKTYGKLSLMVQYHCKVQPLFTVAPGSFSPAPKVNSAIVRLTVYPEPPFAADNLALLEQVIANAFQQRRKTLRNSLAAVADASCFDSAGIDSNLRAEQVSLEAYVELANIIQRARSARQ